MFIGSLPKKLITQMLINVQLKPDVYIGCSGSFRIEHAIKNMMPEKKVSGNDVSLLSCAVGYLLTGQRTDIEFTGRLEPLNQLRGDAVANTAAICLAVMLSRFKGNNQYSQAHFAHVLRNLDDYHRDEKEKLLRYTDGFTLDSFHAGDFHHQIEAARENDGTLIMFAPTYKGGYENLYKFVNENTKWDSPAYGVWDPENIGALVLELQNDNQHFAIITDRRLDGAGNPKPVSVMRYAVAVLVKRIWEKRRSAARHVWRKNGTSVSRMKSGTVRRPRNRPSAYSGGVSSRPFLPRGGQASQMRQNYR